MTEQEREKLIERMANAIGGLSFWHRDTPEIVARAALAVAEPVIREQAENALREENAGLREALKPFAGMVQYCEGMSDSESQCVFVGDLRAARAAMGDDNG